jgi:glutamyl-tRNA reductase
MHSSNVASAMATQERYEKHAKDAEPVIARYRRAMMTIQTAELNRLYCRLPQLDNHSRQAIHQFADSLVATMLGPPVESLQAETNGDASRELVYALERLFRLDRQPVAS